MNVKTEKIIESSTSPQIHCHSQRQRISDTAAVLVLISWYVACYAFEYLSLALHLIHLYTYSRLCPLGWRTLCGNAVINASSLGLGHRPQNWPPHGYIPRELLVRCATSSTQVLHAWWLIRSFCFFQDICNPRDDDWEKERPDCPEMDIYYSEQNHILLCKELVESFQGNKFGVDVDVCHFSCPS